VEGAGEGGSPEEQLRRLQEQMQAMQEALSQLQKRR
jgi:DNA-binding protein YbaB